MNKTKAIIYIALILALSILVSCNSSKQNNIDNITSATRKQKKLAEIKEQEKLVEVNNKIAEMLYGKEEYEDIGNAISKTEEYKELTEANSTFAFNLFSTLIDNKEISANRKMKTNVFISPFSISAALTMTYNGAMGETKLAMAKTLQIDKLDTESINKSFLYLIKVLQKDKNVETSIANSLWGAKGIVFKEPFLNNMETFYNAQLTTLDFLDPISPDIINKWIEDNTKGKIKNMLKKIDPLAILYLVNTIYFKGRWTNPFDKEDTKEGNFNLENGTTKKVMMMNINDEEYNYTETETFQAIALPYGEKRTTRIYIFLPREGQKVYDLAKSFDYNLWKKTKYMEKAKINHLSIPKFRIEFEKLLNDELINMDMGIAFSDGANFNDISDEESFISEVLHSAIIEINEEGAEASASTYIEDVVTDAIEETKTIDFIADHPFLFIIDDYKTNTIMFMGILNDPTA